MKTADLHCEIETFLGECQLSAETRCALANVALRRDMHALRVAVLDLLTKDVQGPADQYRRFLDLYVAQSESES